MTGSAFCLKSGLLVQSSAARRAMIGDRLAFSLAFTLVMSLPGMVSGAHGWEPTQNIEIIAASGPGGDIDTMARLIQNVITQQKLLSVTSSVVNKLGGGHSVGYAYLNQFPGDGHHVLVTSTNLITNYIAGISRIRYSDISPIALLYNEYPVFCVSVDSPLKSAKDLIAQLNANPEMLSIGVGSAIAGANAASVLLATKLLGGDPKKLKLVAFKSSTEATTALIGGHISLVVTSLGIVGPAIESGRLRPLVMAAPKRMGGNFAQVPTWTELGSNVVIGNWRILIGPGALKEEQLDFWDKVMGAVTATATWREDLERRTAVPEYLNSRDSKRFLEEQDALFHSVFTELGMAKK